jgi:hypothetical protein
METGGSSLQEKDHARRMFFYRVMGVKARLWAIDEHESLDSDYERTLVREKLRSSDYQNFYLKISTARAIRDLMEDRVYIDRLAQVLGRAAVSERALRTLYSRMKAELIESFAI